MKTLYLHIGTPKTGTTSIQNFCKENQEALQEIGYYYPMFEYNFYRVEPVRNGHFLVHWKKNGKRNIMEEESLFREGMDRIKVLFRQYDNIILSDESIWRNGQGKKKDIWKKLKKESEEIGFRIKVIIYLRRQDGFATSFWKQQVKAGLRFCSKLSWDEFIHKEPLPLQLDYYDGIKKIEECLGKESIIVRVFEKKKFKNGSIYEDFLDALGLRWNDKFVISNETRNTSLSGNPLEIKRYINKIPELTYGQNTFFRRILTQMVENSGTQKDNTFSEEEAKELMETYAEGNRKIAQEYLDGEEELFDMDFSKIEKTEVDYDSFLEDVIVFTGKAVIALKTENENLKKRMDEQEKEIEEQKLAIEELTKKRSSPFHFSFFGSKNKK